ncbi:UNKNOWN [Stylonychia lemnae]|uniref:Uncharacterized protein n=1 Tax=Stylonychia lemnae TaxID=5949 RepID=A0A077ZXA7_STYLE|nr:UNKNOWN [Stylonychia lemnae]|eukprot:CDW74546.1 UNKNOWN [Stylonychia lemnae]
MKQNKQILRLRESLTSQIQKKELAITQSHLINFTQSSITPQEAERLAQYVTVTKVSLKLVFVIFLRTIQILLKTVNGLCVISVKCGIMANVLD